LGKLGNIEALQPKKLVYVKENFSIKAVLSSDDQEKFIQKQEIPGKDDVLSAWKVL
jgi:hypothetical protein